jgi:hypothetical protein
MANPWDQNAKPEVIAQDPGTGDIFNGVPDWVYEGGGKLNSMFYMSFITFFVMKKKNLNCVCLELGKNLDIVHISCTIR